MEMHKQLFCEHSLMLGQVLWYLLKADYEISKRRGWSPKEVGENNINAFSKEVGRDEIYWWVFKKENNVDLLADRTAALLPFAQQLKESSKRLAENPPEEYDELLSLLRRFSDVHANGIAALHDYVKWLHERDVFAPSMLFNYRVWGSTRLADRSTCIDAEILNTTSLSDTDVRLLTLVAFGLVKRFGYTWDEAHRELSYEQYEAYEGSEDEWVPAPIPENRIAKRASYKAIHEVAIFFELIRNSLNNIQIEISKYRERTDFMASEAFWVRFIEKAAIEGKSEPMIWDFKETLDMWHIDKANIKAQKTVEFCEIIASLANGRGGVIIVGVTDAPPRKVIGIATDVKQLENRLKHVSKAVADHIEYDPSIVYLKQVSINDGVGSDHVCLVVAVAQSMDVVGVRDIQGRYSFPIRRETGLDRVDRETIWRAKFGIHHDNYDFITELIQYTKDG